MSETDNNVVFEPLTSAKASAIQTRFKFLQPGREGAASSNSYLRGFCDAINAVASRGPELQEALKAVGFNPLGDDAETEGGGVGFNPLDEGTEATGFNPNDDQTDGGEGA